MAKIKQMNMVKIFKNTFKKDAQAHMKALVIDMVEGFQKSIEDNKNFVKIQSILPQTNIAAIYWKPIESTDLGSSDFENCDFFWNNPCVIFNDGREFEADWEDKDSLNNLFKLVEASEKDLKFIKKFLSSNIMDAVCAFSDEDYIEINIDCVCVELTAIRDGWYEESMPKYIGQYMKYVVDKQRGYLLSDVK